MDPVECGRIHALITSLEYVVERLKLMSDYERYVGQYDKPAAGNVAEQTPDPFEHPQLPF